MEITFLGLPNNSKAGVALIPAPFEFTTSWQKGTSLAPIEVLKVSPNMEFLDEEFFLEPAKELGFFTYPCEELPFNLEDALKTLEKKVLDALKESRFPIIIGGEHTVSLAGVKAVKTLYPELKLLHFDAHLDLRDEYLGTRINHATVMRRIKELGVEILSIGIRSISSEELEYIKNTNHSVIWAWQVFKEREKVLKKITEFFSDAKVYVSLDIDVIDPGLAPGTGTPEPGGLNWWDLLDILKLVFKVAQPVGGDIVEVKPSIGEPITEYIASKLVFKFGTYILAKKRGLL
ncbi:MAG: agmatinase [Thermodesulfobacteria bacterium]|nr:agmatinase [Thermodesulfobacteriota bacterium]